MKILFLIFYLVTILCIIFLERKSPTEALLWVLVLLCLPYVGVVLYFVFGSTVPIKIVASSRKRRLQKHYPRMAAFKPAKVPDNNLSEVDSQVIKFNSTYNKSKLTSCDDVQIYTTGEEHYEQLFKDIKNAKECIYIEFYTIQHDKVGNMLVESLTQKAGEGVKVLVMLDFIANIFTPPSMFKPLKEAGGKVVRIKPFLTHYRSHRKIVVIDHTIAYIGGMNIGEKYANLDKIKTPWRDTQVRMTGPCSNVLDRYFLTDWLCSIYRKDWNQWVSYVDSLPHSESQLNGNLCQFIVGGVDTDKESVKMCYLSMIRSARKSIRIQTPYFIPDASILDALKTAAAAGVQIELMIPGIKASFFLDPVTTYYCGPLLEYGAKIYKYHGYVHAKTMLIDDEVCCVGSVNMDMRSLMVDDEICGVFYADALAPRYTDIYNEDIKNCDRYTFQDFVTRSRGERIAEGFFLLFAPLM